MDDAIKTFVGSILTPAALLAIFAFVFVIWRTRSLHALVTRCWGLVSGSADLLDGDVRSYGKELHNLSYFQLLTGLRVCSLDEASRLIAWARERRLDLRSAAWCGGYFDSKALRIRTEKLPGATMHGFLLAVVAIQLAASLAIFAFFFNASRVYFQFNDSGNYFYLSHHEARRWFPSPLSPSSEAAPLDADVCREDISDEYLKASGFTRKESFDICSVLVADDAKSQIDGLLGKQKASSFGLLVIFAVLILPLVLWVVWIGHARELDRYLNGSDPRAGFRQAAMRGGLRRAAIAGRRKLSLRGSRARGRR